MCPHQSVTLHLKNLTKTATAAKLLDGKKRWVSAEDRRKLVEIAVHLPAAVDALVMATHLKSRARGYVQGGLFGLALGGVAVGLGSLAQSYGVPGYLLGFSAGALTGGGIALAFRKYKKG